MTPLAYRVMKELTLPLRRRTFIDNGDLLGRLSDLHCFEVSALEAMLDHYVERAAPAAMLKSGLVFLPSARTWIETSNSVFGGRLAFMLERATPEASCRDFEVSFATDRLFYSAHLGRVSFTDDACEWALPRAVPQEQIEAFSRHILGTLVLINSPKVINQKVHAPHRGLERRLVAALGPQGRFPLNAWTTVTLRCGAPQDRAGAPPREAHLTGQRPLHWVRAFPRVRYGKPEVVHEHWRGDASLGIKRSRYEVRP